MWWFVKTVCCSILRLWQLGTSTNHNVQLVPKLLCDVQLTVSSVQLGPKLRCSITLKWEMSQFVNALLQEQYVFNVVRGYAGECISYLERRCLFVCAICVLMNIGFVLADSVLRMSPRPHLSELLPLDTGKQASYPARQLSIAIFCTVMGDGPVEKDLWARLSV